MKRLVIVISALLAVAGIASARDFTVKSPSGNVEVRVTFENRELSWSVKNDGSQLLEPGKISMTLSDGTVLGHSKVMPKAIRRSCDDNLKALVPTKFRIVRDHYNELTLRFGKDWAVAFRAYDNGVAYRFITYYSTPIEVLDEQSEWKLSDAGEWSAYWPNEKSPSYITHCEANFDLKHLSVLASDKANYGDTYAYLPLSMSVSRGPRCVITEADLFDYPNMMLRVGDDCVLRAEFPHVIDEYEMRTDRDVNIVRLADCIARTQGERTFPWRLMTIDDTDAALLENTLAWQLSSPEVPGDYSWLKPGKISWEWWAILNVYGVDFKAGVNTETYKYYVDFAAKYGLEYILMDEGWSKSTLNIMEPKEDLDVQGIISYAKSRGVGVVLWALWTPFVEHAQEIFDTYQKWGVSGIKIDFMQMQDQNMVRFYEMIAQEAAKRHLLVDYHGAFKPSGLQRKYPNAMTFEGVYGMEHDKCSFDISPDHDLKLPFTRMVAGPMDYTPGAVNNATREDFAVRWSHPMSQGTRSHQAALFVAFESPLTMLCDTPSNYYRAPEFTEFISRIPTVWEETVAQEAEAGSHLLLSRRTSDGRWYSAALGSWCAYNLTLDTSFLGEGEWDVTIHEDGVNADVWAEDYKIVRTSVRAGDKLDIRLAQGGGWVAEFVKRQ